MVKDTIDPDPKYVFHHPNVQSILLWLFQSQDDPNIQKNTNTNQKNARTIQKMTQQITKKTKNEPKNDPMLT